HRTRQQPRFQENLKAITDAEYQTTIVSKLLHGPHDRGKPGDRTSAQIVPIRKPARDHNRVEARQQGLFVPDHLHRLTKHVPEDMLTIVVTIAAWENEHSDFHALHQLVPIFFNDGIGEELFTHLSYLCFGLRLIRLVHIQFHILPDPDVRRVFEP